MTRDKILSDLFTSKEFIQCIAKMEPVELQEELKAEVALVLCEMNTEKLMGLAERNELKYYTVRIIINQIQSKSSPFYKKFRKSPLTCKLVITDFERLDLNADQIHEEGIKPVYVHLYNEMQKALHDNQKYDDRSDRAIAEIENLPWYDREMLKLYAEYGTYRKIEEITQIPWESAYKTIKKACKEIKSKIA